MTGAAVLLDVIEAAFAECGLPPPPEDVLARQKLGAALERAARSRMQSGGFCSECGDWVDADDYGEPE